MAVSAIIFQMRPHTKTLLITGATRGLGLETARAAARSGDVHLFVSGRDPDAVARVAAEVGGEPIVLDLASLEGTRRTVAALPQIDLLAANAGLQVPGERTVTADGFETTVQVNHLAHLLLIDELLGRATEPMRIALVGSGTHDPAARSGMPPPLALNVGGLIAGEADDPASGRRRYSTSKLLVTATALGLARERRSDYIYCFDPGLMPGTGLARQYSGWQRALWSSAMRALTVMPFASTPRRSGRALAALLTEDPPAPSGSVLDHRAKPAAVSARAAEASFQDEVLSVSRELLESRR